jgi:hypothetical protein
MDEKKGYTLWEKWTGRASPPPVARLENSIANPLKLHCGDFITARMLEGNDRPFTVTEVREYVRRIGGEDFHFADYVVRQGDEVRILRANPKDGHTAAGLQDCDLLWLKVFYEMDFDKNVREAVTQKQFEVDNDDDGTPDVTYDALNAGEDGYLAQVRIARMGEPALSGRSLRYWDFYRKGDPKKNEIADEDIFFFVEIEESDGYTVMLEGAKISGNDIEVYPMDDKKQP